MISDKSKVLSLWAMIRWFMVIVLFSIGLLHIRFRETTTENMLIIYVFGGIIALNLLFQIHSIAKQRWIDIFQIVSDIGFATLIVHLTGGLNSYFVWVYLIGVITASLTIPQNGGIIAGLIGSMSLLILIILYQNGVVTPTESTNLDATGSTVYILSYTGLFCGVAMIASFLNDQLNLQKSMTSNLDKLSRELSTINDWKSEFDTLKPILKDLSQLDHDINTPLCIITLSLGRIKRYSNELQNEGLQKSNNEITEAVNKISIIMHRIQSLKEHPLMIGDHGKDGLDKA